MGVNEQIIEASASIEKVLADCSQLATKDLAPLVQGFRTARGLAHLRQALTDEVMRVVMDLQGSKLGFLSDKTYPIEVVRDSVVEAMMLGLRPTGNEFNIIAGNCYAAKNGLLRLVREFPGLTNLYMTPGVAELRGNMALQPMRAQWLLNGEPWTMVRDKSEDADTRFMIRVNSGMGPDAIVGKAERKMAAAIYTRLTGLEVGEGDATEAVNTVGHDVTPPAPPEQDGRRIRMGKGAEN